MTEVVDEQLVADLTQSLVSTLAPGELPLFGAMSQAWFADPKRVQASEADDVLAFGAAETAALLTPVLLAAATHVLTYLGQELGRSLAASSITYVRDQLRNLFHRRGADVSLNERQIAKVRAITIETAHRFRIPKQKAHEIADAVMVRFVSDTS